MSTFITVFYDWSRIVAGYFAWAGPLVVRIVVGWVFLWSGWEKLQILPVMVKRFAD
jgi:putative oxidoreductase